MPSVTLLELKNQIYARLDGNALLYPVPDVVSAINEQIVMVNWATGFLQSTQAINSIRNRVWYSIPSGILIPLRVQFEDRVLEPVDYENMGCRVPNWTAITNIEALSVTANWIPLGFKFFGIYPVDAVGGALMRITGVTQPTPLVLDSDTIALTNEYADMIVALSSQVLQLRESAVMFGQASLQYQEYLAKLKRLKAWRAMQMPVYFVQKAEAQR